MRLHKLLENETQQKEKLEGEIATLHSQLLQLSLTADEVKNIWIFHMKKHAPYVSNCSLLS